MSEETHCFLIKTLLHKIIPEHYLLVCDGKVLFITSYENALKDFLKRHYLPLPLYQTHPVLAWAEEELREYFAGHRKDFTFPFKLSGTPFQQAIYQTLYKRVKYGHTVSYGDLASMAGYPGAARAVGSAMKNNPLPFIIPCHRVIKADGTPGQYGGGAAMKQMLINMERVMNGES
ncbi:MAG: methylated-DNA--[protein]-cysteine S-methyltransferase [Fidelibacterota bacterium]